MPEKISILKESGETLSSNVVSVFMIPDTEKRYIITTENAVDPHGLTVLHVSEIVNGTLQRVATDEEWSTIKTIMRAIISGNVGSYQYLPTIENISASGQYSRDISVSASASKQMIDNYAAGEKNASATTDTAADETSAAPILDASMASPTVAQPSSIFPTGGNQVNNEDELIPGIAEVSADSNVGATQVMSEQSPVNVSPVQNNNILEPSVVAPSTPIIDMNNTIVPEQPISVQQPTMDQGVNINQASGINEVPVNNLLNTNPITPVVGNENVTNMSASNIQLSNDLLSNQQTVQQNVIDTNLNTMTGEKVNTDVQVVGPTQVVPTAQIVQEAQSPLTNDIKFDNNAVPSFNPNATLDEVVMGAQEMFMEGVKNLVQSIQEKVYRDLYNKEAELKMREAAVEQREQFVNGQMMAMMSNFGAMPMQQTMQMTQPIPQIQSMQMGVAPVSTVQTTTPVQSVVTPTVTGPTVVSAANDAVQS